VTFYENYLNEIFKGPGVSGVVSAWGLDGNSQGMLFERNVIERTEGLGFFHSHQRTRNTWINNNFDFVEWPALLEHEPEWSSAQFSLSAEFMIGGAVSGTEWLVCKELTENHAGHYGLFVQGSRIGAYINTGDDGVDAGHLRTLIADRDLIPGTENSGVLTYDGSVLKLYVNGTPAGALSVGLPFWPQTGNLGIGQRVDGDNPYQNGINHLRLWNRTLSSLEISDWLVQAAGEPEAGKVFAWDLTAEVTGPDFNSIKGRSGPREPYLTWLGTSRSLVIPTLHDQVVAAGGSVRFSVDVEGHPGAPLLYQWQFDGEDLPGKTGPTLVLQDVGWAQQGTYAVVVSNDISAPITRSATLGIYYAHDDLVTNGSMEDSGLAGTDDFLTYDSDPNAIAAWVADPLSPGGPYIVGAIGEARGEVTDDITDTSHFSWAHLQRTGASLGQKLGPLSALSDNAYWVGYDLARRNNESLDLSHAVRFIAGDENGYADGDVLAEVDVSGVKLSERGTARRFTYALAPTGTTSRTTLWVVFVHRLPSGQLHLDDVVVAPVPTAPPPEPETRSWYWDRVQLLSPLEAFRMNDDRSVHGHAPTQTQLAFGQTDDRGLTSAAGWPGFADSNQWAEVTPVRRTYWEEGPVTNMTAGAGTVVAWINPRFSGDSTQVFVLNSVDATGNNINADKMMNLYLRTDGDLGFGIDQSVIEAALAMDTTLNQWFMVAATWDQVAGETHLYLNGSVVAHNLSASWDDIGAMPLFYVGKARPDASRDYSGYIDEIAVWANVLSASQIAGLCRSALTLPVRGTVVILR